MKKLLLTFSLILFTASLFAQVNAGPDQNICIPQTATLTATVNPNTLASTSYTISTIPFAPDPYTGTAITMSDDSQAGPFPIGFSFNFFGTCYTQFYIGSNGWVAFSPQPTTYTSATIPSTSGTVPKNCIMGPWQDWHPGVGTGPYIRYQTLGTAPFRRLVVSYSNLPMYSCTSTIGTFQITIYETTNIIDNHIQSKLNCTSWAGGTAVQGLHNAAGTVAVVVPGRNSTQWTAANDSRRYTPSGAPAYTITWTTGATTVGTGPTITVAPTTTTTYIATATYPCNITMSDQVTVFVGTASSSVTPATSNICQGGPGVQLTATAASATSYSWSPAAGLSCVTCPNPIANPSATTIYTVTITTPSCSAIGTATVNVTPLPTVNAGPDVSICQGGSGATLAATSNGTTYSWSPAAGLSCTTCLTPVANPTVTTTYVLTSTNGSCSSQDTVIVTVNPQPVANAGPDQNICAGTGATLTGSGGGSYLWNPSTGLSCSTCATTTANPAQTTSYTLTVSQGNCTSTDDMTLTVTPLPAAYAGVDDTICPGGSTVLNATGGGTYAWSPAQGLSNTAVSNPTANPTVTTTYTLTVTGPTGCTSTDQVTIVVPQPLTLAVAGFPATCNGSCNGQTVVIPSGGIQPYSYLWSPGGQTTASVMNQCAGTYTIQVTDAVGCVTTSTVGVTEPTALSLTTSVIDAHCSQNDGSASITVSGGTPGYTYLWPSGGTSPTEPNLYPGSYCVIVKDANNCPDTACVSVANLAGVSASIVSFTNATCNGMCDGAATITASGGNGPYNYQWSSGGTGTTETNLCAGTYTVTVTDANNCTSIITVTITEPAPVVTSAPAPVTICIGQSATLAESATGGTGPYTYAWTPGGPIVSPVVTTSYSVFATDANGCTSPVVTTTVTVHQPLSVTGTGTASICPGDQTTLSASSTGGNGTYNYTWLPGPITGSTVNVSPSTTTTYTVVVTDGCTTPPDSAYVTVTVLPLPVVSFTSDVTSGCEPLCVNFTNTTPNTASVAWNFSNAASTQLVSNNCFQVAGSYSVGLTITDNNGCVNTLSQPNYITVHPNPVADFTFGPQPTTVLSAEISFQDASAGIINAWEWHFGDISDSQSSLQNPQFTYSDSGLYQVTLIVTTVYGCTDQVMYTVEIRPDFAFYMPTAFTPNGDGLNDTFGPKGMGVDDENFELMIFDRWGNMVFHTTQWMKNWDGRVNNQDIVLEDVFVWKAVFSDQYGTKHQYMGHVAIVK
jgi:gliding motility-associated-like protein